jgi:predicted SnoaL-like aldol condensation-catalyzing enzyme
MPKTRPEQNKTIVLKAFDTLFNKRDYAAAERFWSPNYIQHSAHIEPGRDGLFNLIKAAPPSLKYEPGVILAEGEYVIVHGRFSNIGLPVNSIAADVVRLKDGIGAGEHASGHSRRGADFSLNTGTSFRTRPPSNSPRAGIRCLAAHSRSKHGRKVTQQPSSLHSQADSNVGVSSTLQEQMPRSRALSGTSRASRMCSKMFRWLLNSIANTWSLTSSGKIGEHYSPLTRSQLNQNQALSKKPV